MCDLSTMRSSSMKITPFAAFLTTFLAFVCVVQGFSFKSIHWTPKELERLEGLSEYEIVTPVRLDDRTGLPLPSDSSTRHFEKRSAGEKRSPGGDMAEEDKPQATFLLGAFHQQFQLNLSRDNSFFSPSFVVEFFGNKDEESDDMDELDASAPLHCFYKGIVNGQPSSSAVFSLCDGMYGLFQTPEGMQYFVEPLAESTSAAEGSTRPHVVYPTTALQDLNKNSGCGLTDEDLSSKGPKPNSTNHLPGSHHRSHPHHRSHHRDERQYHSKEPRTPNNLATQLYQTHQRISKSITRQDRGINITYEASTDSPHSRAKRFISYTRHVELMVVADSKMVTHHGANVEHYLLTLVALVNKIFKDPSIGNDINIVLVKLLVLQREEENLSITSDATQTLRSFCTWQRTQNHKEDTHPHHYDTAVLITKEDICRSTLDCDTLGLAELGTMCDSLRSCSIVQDNGLSAAFTMAHELGHVFNLPHDDNTKCQEHSGDGFSKQGVMAPTLNYQINPWNWSRCSQVQITEYLDMGYGNCLLDSPTDPQVLPSYQPGEVYNVSKQCELVFGEGSSVCPFMRTCSRLWCTGSSQGSQRGCRTQHMPWSDGTPCGHNKWCDRGECIDRRHNIVPIDGGWGKWQPFGKCSRTCGGGVKQAIRRCTQPVPSNGGKYCTGRRVRFSSCNSQPCPENSIPFRDQQCASYNGNSFNIQGVPRDVRWVPKYAGVQIKDRCILFCRVEGSIAYYKLAKKVKDGTLCGPDTDDICVQGRCWQAGCDHILGSQTTRDDCGVCGGNNQACKTVTGTYNKTEYGYNKVVDIPTDSTRIDVRQRSLLRNPYDDNYLAIRKSTGEYLLNGNFVVSMFQREIKIGDAVMEYSGSGNPIEKITCHDKINANISIYVLSVGDVLPPDIHYSYNIPIKHQEIYVWDSNGPWTECSKICKGEKEQGVRCLRQQDHTLVSDDKCSGRRPQPTTSRCNTGCQVHWSVRAESLCSVTCGVGRQTRRIHCMKKITRRRISAIVADSNCAELDRPAEVVECRQSECQQAHWEYSEWSQCSQSCDSGTRRRSTSCRDSNGYYILDGHCDSATKHVVEQCNTEQCPIWAVESWSDCSVTCGEGEMHRSVRCYHGNQMVSPTMCDQSLMPAATKHCQTEECSTWHQGEWGPCSVTCGEGTSHRLVRCMQGNQPADTSHCDPNLKPDTTRSCEVTKCPFWHQGEWSSCSVSCGQGEKQRLVSCYQGNFVVDFSQCNRSLKPESRVTCDMGECPVWQEGSWGPCSVTCGHGEQQRQVSCYQGNQKVDVHHCDSDRRPDLVSSCDMEECPMWMQGEWGQCSVTCGQGTQLRPVRCYRGDQHVDDSECDPALLPASTRLCQDTECAAWKHGDWQHCSGTCGKGEKRRFVGCYRGNREVAGSQCDQATNPDSVASCEMEECPAWHQGKWGPCSTTCGPGEKQRTVGCYQSDTELELSQCDLTLMPEGVSPCEVADCAYWQHGEWGPCSSSCGEGQKRRSINCYQGNQVVDDSQCDVSTTPDTVVLCQSGECPTWKAEDWGECSLTCGPGSQQRRIECYQGNEQVDIHHCDLTMMPDTIRNCEIIECTDWYQGEWGPCSVTCGQGEMQRRVSCSQGSRNVDINLCDQSQMPKTVLGCEMPECPTWHTEPWGQCSATCGEGQMQRAVHCYQDNRSVDISQCDLTLMPASTRECKMSECPIWRHGTWGPCSVSCGLGYQLRGIQCRQTDDTPIPDTMCNQSDKPPNRQDCRMPLCPTPTLPSSDSPSLRSSKPVPTIPRTTYAAPLTTVFVRPPSSLMPRQSPRSQRPSASQRSSLADALTVVRPVSDPQPAMDQRPAPKSSPITALEILSEQPYRRYSSRWRTGMWTECSVTCGYGTQERYVSCRDTYNAISEERECDLSTRPPSIEQCQIKACPHWRTGQWNRCSVSCGQGTTSRYVACVNGDSSIAPDDNCDLLDKPKDKDVCSHQDCPVEQPVSSGFANERAWPLQRAQWSTGQWNKCSTTCGSGLRQRRVICQDEKGIVETCPEETRPPNIEACNTGTPCPLWSYGDWGQCSATCGGGIKSRLVLCRLRSGRTLLDSSCNILSRPENTRLCGSNPCPNRSRWRSSLWNRCSVTCGIGIQQRIVSCEDEKGVEKEDGECETTGEAKLATERMCQQEACPGLEWRVVDWSQCSVTCGIGSQQRTVTCEDEAGNTRDDGECETAGETKPDTERTCQQEACPRSEWKIGNWSQCSVTCGSGFQQRTVTCKDEEGNTRDDSECKVEAPQPASRRQCHEVECPKREWRVGDWSQCSVTCGVGSHQRTVTCEDEAGNIKYDRECEVEAPQPSLRRQCQEVECQKREWRVGNWSLCSVTCGVGFYYRTVTCEDEAGNTRDDSNCEIDISKPASRRECQEVECSKQEWRIGDWSQCSVTCGVGSKQRTVTCEDETRNAKNDSECQQKAPRPDSERPCKLAQCSRPQWRVSDWSQCSATCGVGFRQRTVTCKDGDGKIPDVECEMKWEKKPAAQRMCRLSICPRPKWIVSDWTECSVTCDRGVRVREVTCQIKGQILKDAMCLQHKIKPKMSKRCSREKCNTYHWKKGRWSQCSKSCNGGRRHRMVQCTDSKDIEVDNSICSAQRMPRDNTKCNTHSCNTPRLMWMAGPWGECSTTCGPGTQTRTVTCQAHSPDGWPMPTDDVNCNQNKRPQVTRPCFISLCASDMHWKMGPWSQCSKECGRGIRERKVQCRDGQGKRQTRSNCGPPTIRPETREICNYKPCHPKSCLEVQLQHNLHEDKDYSILVQGRPLTVYCHGMTTNEPQEFINLPAGEVENFAEIYAKRLIRATQCPYNGHRNDACECKDEGHPQAGLTTFRKLRLNMTNMEIIISDPTFADVHYGKFVPYATAGDCYSSANCPQGRFHINLIGTQLALAPHVDWSTEGYAVTRRLARDKVGQRVAGRCGGFCGMCFPDRREGLRVTFVS